MDTTHQAPSLAIKIRVNLLLKSGFVKISAAHSDTQSNSLLLSFACDILVYCYRRVDATAFLEQGSDSPPRALGSNEYDINICWDIDFGKILEYR